MTTNINKNGLWFGYKLYIEKWTKLSVSSLHTRLVKFVQIFSALEIYLNAGVYSDHIILQHFIYFWIKIFRKCK